MVLSAFLCRALGKDNVAMEMRERSLLTVWELQEGARRSLCQVHPIASLGDFALQVTSLTVKGQSKCLSRHILRDAVSCLSGRVVG